MVYAYAEGSPEAEKYLKGKVHELAMIVRSFERLHSWTPERTLNVFAHAAQIVDEARAAITEADNT